MTATITPVRNATLADLSQLLTDQQALKFDVVAPAASVRSVDGTLVLKGTESILNDEGVKITDGRYTPTVVADEGIADKLGIPIGYLRRLRAERVDLYDTNLNGWLQGRRERARYNYDTQSPETLQAAISPDSRSFLVRCFKGADGEGGIARAFLSDRYATMDNLDALTAALDGVRKSGVEAHVVGCDLTERRMSVRLAAPGVAVLAPELLKGYRNPFSDEQVAALRQGEAVDFGYGAVDQPLVFAGFELSNSETGGGAFTIVPRLIVKVCNNGMKITADAMRQVHLGGRLDEGIVHWSADTQQKNVELIGLKARDAVTNFLSRDYVQACIDKLERQAGRRIDKPVETIREVGKKLAFSEETIAGVMDFFITGGVTTAAGIMHAATAYAQTVADPDEASEIENRAVRAMELAAA